MSRLFLATSFSQQIDPLTNQVLPEFRQLLTDILITLRQAGFTVFCAAEHENWLISNDPPATGVSHDLAEIDQSDAVLAILHDKPSTGVQFEMGYACGKNKRVFAATNNIGLAYFNQGLAELKHLTHLNYTQPAMLAKQIKHHL